MAEVGDRQHVSAPDRRVLAAQDVAPHRAKKRKPAEQPARTVKQAHAFPHTAPRDPLPADAPHTGYPRYPSKNLAQIRPFLDSGLLELIVPVR
jgi:hypothetical protein